MNPLKLSNAGSYGIPTVAYPEPAYIAEWNDECLWASTISELVAQVKRLKETPSLYADISGRAVAKAEGYHIENIAQLYEQLPQ